MRHYIHHVPGRLRIRVPALKRNPAGAARVSALLAERSGILRQEVKDKTGSLLIIYDREALCPRSLVGALQRAGWVAADATWEEAPQSADVAGTVGTAGRRAGKAVAGMVAEKVLERSAAALVAAVF